MDSAVSGLAQPHETSTFQPVFAQKEWKYCYWDMYESGRTGEEERPARMSDAIPRSHRMPRFRWMPRRIVTQYRGMPRRIAASFLLAGLRFAPVPPECAFRERPWATNAADFGGKPEYHKRH